MPAPAAPTAATGSARRRATRATGPIRRLATLSCAALVLYACGSSGGGGAEDTPATEVLNGITVPLAPDAASNAASLAGIDTNNNQVRDDVERSLAQATSSPQSYIASAKVAAAYQQLVSTPSIERAAALAVFKAAHCAAMQAVDAGTALSDPLEATLNTPERRAAFNAAARVLGSFSTDELGACE